MEYCVLIPKELSLASGRRRCERTQFYPSKDRSSLFVVANTKIPKGTCFKPLEGTVRYGKVDLDEDQLPDTPSTTSWMHPFFDSVIDNRRHCNWIKFLIVTTKYNDEVNFMCTSKKGEVIYEATKTIVASSKLVAFYDQEKDISGDEYLMQLRLRQEMMDQILELTPIDLSRKLLVSELVSTWSEPLKPLSPAINVKTITSHRGRHGNGLSCSRNMLPCEVCGKKFDRPSLLRRHMRTHTGEKPHVCDVCGKGFSTSSSLNTHRRIHSGEKPHQCPICGKRFTASSNLYYHRMTHTKDKPHKCTMCGKSFPTPGDLKAHAYIHNGHWPFKCSICNRGFSKQTNLKNHLFLHTGDKPHVCKICEKRFALACNLRAHLKTHQTHQQTLTPSKASSASSSPSTSSSSLMATAIQEDKSLVDTLPDVEPNLQQFFLMTASLLAAKYGQRQEEQSMQLI